MDQNEKAHIYNQLGMIKDNQGKYQEAIKSYEKVLETDQKTLPPNHLCLSCSYNNIGFVY
jgi:tetratricopeptide (TPR) repeat protein